MLTNLSLPWIAMLLLWLGWVISWGVASVWADRSTAVARPTAELRYRLLTVLGVALLALPLLKPFRPIPSATVLYPQFDPLTWLCAAAAAAGFAFCWWARLHLGRLWSSNVARKADHRVIDTGPYAIVRHPIYTGIIAAGVAVAIAEGTATGFVGLALFITSFYIKARMEEDFLRTELGPEAYDAYRARVPMLVPFWPVRRPAN